MKKRWGKTEKRKIERVKEKANQLSTVSKRNAAQFYKYTRLAKEKKANLLWRYRYVADRDAWVERIERGRERERRRGVCPRRHMSHGSTEGMIHGQGTLAHAPNFASHTGRQAHHLTY